MHNYIASHVSTILNNLHEDITLKLSKKNQKKYLQNKQNQRDIVAKASMFYAIHMQCT
jgi:hypothetical protein